MPLAMTGSRARLPSADSTRREPATEPAHNVTLSRPTSVSARTCRGCDGSRATRVGHTLGMGDTSGHHRSRWRLTPWGWILTVAVPVLVVLAIVDPSPGVIMGLIVAIFVWAGPAGLELSFKPGELDLPREPTLNRLWPRDR